MDLITADTPVAADPLADISAYFTSQIRAEIEHDVKELIVRLKGQYGVEYMPTSPIEPDYILIGYLINTHRGRSLYQDGDMIAGVPVRVDRTAPRTITACAEGVEFEYEEEVRDEKANNDEDRDGDVWVTKTRYATEDLRESVTW